MKQNITFFLFLIVSILFSQTKSPSAFLGYELGSRFTQHHKIVNYFEHVAVNNTNVKFVEYGETYEHRPLKLAFITAQKNFDKLEELRTNHLTNIGVIKGNNTNEDIAIVWLSYNVHGNEAVSSEVSMKTLYELINPKNGETKKWLENTIVIIDPCLNPDGRQRYVNWYTQHGNYPYNVSLDAKEHRESNPNGRANHYLFDLNRDWAWLSQKESQARIKIYNKWLPNIHVDFHEQDINEEYYFAPAAEPYHEIITDFQRDFQKTIGKNHAKYFDKEGWLFFTNEIFDLFYPSYGDSYPIFNGAIGMTYEQAGSGRGGLGVKIEDGSILTLKERIAHHFTTSLSTIETASVNANTLVSEFQKYFNDNTNYQYNSYVISSDNGKDKINSLRKLLDQHLIKYGNPTNTNSLNGLNFYNQQNENYKLNTSDLVINLNQPKAKFIKALFEANSKLPDSLTYDITAWSLPYARGLKTFASKKNIEIKNFSEQAQTNADYNNKTYAYLCKWNSINDVAFLSELLQHNIKVRFAKKSFIIDGKSYKPGTLIITKINNKKHPNFNETVQKLAIKHKRDVVATTSGMVTKGKDFGSRNVSLIHKPNIAVLSGKNTSSLSFGAIWHFFEQQIGYPITVIDTDYFSRINLNKYQVLILPSGYYGKIFDKEGMKDLQSWIEKGGRLIVVGKAVSTFAQSDSFSISNRKQDDDEDKDKEEVKPIKYDELQRNYLSNMTTGAIFKAKLDNSNPLAFGYDDFYYTLKLNSNNYPLIKNGQNVAYIKDKKELLNGFSGKNTLDKIDNTLVFGIESKGRGKVIYLADDPLYRSFWENGKLLFSNAVFIVR